MFVLWNIKKLLLPSFSQENPPFAEFAPSPPPMESSWCSILQPILGFSHSCNSRSTSTASTRLYYYRRFPETHLHVSIIFLYFLILPQIQGCFTPKGCNLCVIMPQAHLLAVLIRTHLRTCCSSWSWRVSYFFHFKFLIITKHE